MEHDDARRIGRVTAGIAFDGQVVKGYEVLESRDIVQSKQAVECDPQYAEGAQALQRGNALDAIA